MLTLNYAGPPVGHTFPTGETAIDSNGDSWYCVTGGTPGTWIGGTLTWPSAGHPTTGTWQTGQTVIDTLGHSWYCTTGGTSGQWAGFNSNILSGATAFAQGGSATQLTIGGVSVLDRNAMIHFRFSTGGSAVTFTVGPTSTPTNTLVGSFAPNTGSVSTIMLPAGYYLAIGGTGSTISTQYAITF